MKAAASAAPELRASQQPERMSGLFADAYEREADRVADAVMRTPMPPSDVSRLGAPRIQGRCSTCEGDECACAQKQPIGLASPTGQVDAAAFAGRGEPLPADTRRFFEGRLRRRR